MQADIEQFTSNSGIENRFTEVTMAENNFQNVMKSLMDGANGVLTSKTVVGSPIEIGDTILVPLSDVTIGCGAGANNGNNSNAGGGGFSAKMSPSAVLIIKNGNTKVVNIKDQTNITRLIDMVPETVDKILSLRKDDDLMDGNEAVELAFGEAADEPFEDGQE